MTSTKQVRYIVDDSKEEYNPEDAGDNVRVESKEETETKDLPFLFLSLELPPQPLFKGDQEQSTIPQVPLFTLLHKFDGETITHTLKNEMRRFRLKRLPPYLIIYYIRIQKNTQGRLEKNPTIVNFPVKNLEMREYSGDGSVSYKYDLVSNICHDGLPEGGHYKCHTYQPARDQWFMCQDLQVEEVHTSLIPITESYLQIYELKSVVKDPSKLETESVVPEAGSSTPDVDMFGGS
eukprot:Rmarinus@m.3069